MNVLHSPIAVYTAEKERLLTLLQGQKKKRNLLGWIRLFIILLTAVISYQLFTASVLGGVIALVLGIAAFLFIVNLDVDNNTAIKNTETRIRINEEELQVLENKYFHLYDGHAFLPDVHDYAHDLDIFGKASLYQYINRGYSEQGRSLLANNLLYTLPAEAAEERSEAVKELAPLFNWRQGFQALSMEQTITKKTEQHVKDWLAQEETHFTGRRWKIIVPVYTFIALSTALLAITGYMASASFSFLFIVFLIISSSLSRKALQAYTLLNGVVKELSTLQQLMAWIEGQSFTSPLLMRLQALVKTVNTPASVQIKQLNSILGRFDLRLNVLVFIFLNSYLLWDVRQMMALNNWRRKNKQALQHWFHLIAEIEVLHSLATLSFNQPQWPFPNFSKQHFTLSGKDIGHPLIPVAQRVNSDFDMQGVAKVALITGSNMAGKSTFLRSLGVNMVLAAMGAPVCAKQFVVSPVRLMSSMRIADNLSENTSTFYAELKKLKTIIDAVREQKPVFVLLDEILRGTNSLDRHIGSKALIQQLIKEKAVAVIATHDVEIAKLEEDHPNGIHNYHFDVQVEGEELYFDYKLKEGVCTSLNASILMKKIGIEL